MNHKFGHEAMSLVNERNYMPRFTNFYVSWSDAPDFEAGEHLNRVIKQCQIKVASRVDTYREEGAVKTLDALIEHAPDCQCQECTGTPPPYAQEPFDPLDYYRAIIRHGSGIITLPNHLGVMVGTDATKTPAGWLFVDIKDLTPEALKEYVDTVRTGRETWPKN